MESLKRLVISILVWQARVALKRYQPRIIAITGSVGKTTTKDAIEAAISPEVRARKSEKSYNGELGVTLTILGLENAWRSPWGWAINLVRGAYLVVRRQEYPDYLVLEVGADRPGDIRRIASWLRPDIAVITGVSEIPAHVEFFDSPEHVFKEKRALAEYLRPGGTLVLNGDDPRMRDLRGAYRGVSVLYGCDEDNDYSASHREIFYENESPVGVRFRANHGNASVPISIRGALGTPRVYGALAAVAVADAIGIDHISATHGLRTWSPQSGRVRLLAGLKDSIIIDDTYNSSPAAALAALDTLKETKAKRRIAVLGDMLELGKFTKEAHRTVGERAARSAEALITIGIRSRHTAEGALDAGMRDERISQYESTDVSRAADELASVLQPGDVVLVKGSQSMRLERFVLRLMADPDHAADLLVRMEPEWQSR